MAAFDAKMLVAEHKPHWHQDTIHAPLPDTSQMFVVFVWDLRCVMWEVLYRIFFFRAEAEMFAGLVHIMLCFPNKLLHSVKCKYNQNALILKKKIEYHLIENTTKKQRKIKYWNWIVNVVNLMPVTHFSKLFSKLYYHIMNWMMKFAKFFTHGRLCQLLVTT